MQGSQKIEYVKKSLALGSDSDLARFLNVTYPTVQNWKQGTPGSRSSKQSLALSTVIHVIDKLESLELITNPLEMNKLFLTPFAELGNKSFRDIITEDVKNEESKEFVLMLAKIIANKQDAPTNISSAEEIKKIYGEFSDRVCRSIAAKTPQILVNALENSSDAVEKSILIEAIPYSEDEGFIEGLFVYLNDISPMVRDSTAIALHSYAEDSPDTCESIIFPALRKRLEKEESEGVKQSITEALNCHTFEF